MVGIVTFEKSLEGILLLLLLTIWGIFFFNVGVVVILAIEFVQLSPQEYYQKIREYFKNRLPPAVVYGSETQIIKCGESRYQLNKSTLMELRVKILEKIYDRRITNVISIYLISEREDKILEFTNDCYHWAFNTVRYLSRVSGIDNRIRLIRVGKVDEVTDLQEGLDYVRNCNQNIFSRLLDAQITII